MKRVAIILADGAEEMEAVIVVDLLRRAGMHVDIVALEPGPVECSRGVRIQPDLYWANADLDVYAAIVLPGGMGGVERLRDDARVIAGLREMHAKGRLVAAICAGPLVLQQAGLIEGRRVTCHPGAAAMLTAADRLEDRVVRDGNIVTSQGPGTAIEFALGLIDILIDDGQARSVAADLVFA